MMRVTWLLLLLGLLPLSGCRPSWARAVRIAVSNAPVPDVSGTWNTHWGDRGEEYIAVLALRQEGDRVLGSYTTTARVSGVEGTIPGSLEGRLVGNELRGTWDEGGARFGSFRFVFSSDARAYDGTYGNGDSEDTGGTWFGKR